MRNSLWMKGLVLGIIMLFVGTSVISAYNENLSINSKPMQSGNILYIQEGDIVTQATRIDANNLPIIYSIPYLFNKQLWSASTWDSTINIRSVYNNTQIAIDVDGNGTIDYRMILNESEIFSLGYTSITSGSLIYSSKLVQIDYQYYINDYGIYDDCLMSYTILPSNLLGKFYWIPTSSTLVACSSLENDTIVSVDYNNDGVWEHQAILNKGDNVTFSNVPEGTYITSNNIIAVSVLNYNITGRDNTYAYCVTPLEYLQSEYVIPLYDYDQLEYNVQIDLTTVYIVSAEPDNTISIYETGSSPNQTRNLNLGEVYAYASPVAGALIHGTKKFFAVYVFDAYEIDPWAGVRRHQARAVPLMSSVFGSTQFIFYGWYDYGTGPYWSVPAGLRFIIIGLENSTQVTITKSTIPTSPTTLYVNKTKYIVIDAPNENYQNQVAWARVKSTKPILVYVGYNSGWGNNADSPDGYILTGFNQDNNPPYIKIEKPKKALYIFDSEKRIYFLKFRIPLLIGKITIEVNATDKESGINRVEFYINGRLIGKDTTEPYNYLWKWNRPRIFHIYILKVIAYDNAGNSAIERIIVRKFL